MAQSSELRQDLTIIRNFIDHSHHSLARLFKKYPDCWSGQGFHLQRYHLPLGRLVLMHSTESTMQQRNIPKYPMEFIKPAINLQNEYKTCKLTAQHRVQRESFLQLVIWAS